MQVLFFWSEVWLIVWMVLFGLGTGAFMLGFWVGKEFNSLILAGSIVAMINTGDAIFGAISEPSIGGLLDMFSTQNTWGGTPIFFAIDYQMAFFILPVYLLVASCLLICLGFFGSRS